MRKAIRLCINLADHDVFKDIIADRVTHIDVDRVYDDALEAWSMWNVGSSHHICGTCKMGPETDPFAMLDQFGRVRGLEELRVADASIMPGVIGANTNATSIMIGERVADWIARGQ